MGILLWILALICIVFGVVNLVGCRAYRSGYATWRVWTFCRATLSPEIDTLPAMYVRNSILWKV